MTMNGVYDPALVVLSIVVAIFASYTALRVANRMIGADRSASRMWLSSAAVVVGIGIWSMHFIGMLALSMPMTVTYDLGLTLLSMVLPILVAGTALHLVERWGVGWRPTLGALVARARHRAHALYRHGGDGNARRGNRL